MRRVPLLDLLLDGLELLLLQRYTETFALLEMEGSAVPSQWWRQSLTWNASSSSSSNLLSLLTSQSLNMRVKALTQAGLSVCVGSALEWRPRYDSGRRLTYSRESYNGAVGCKTALCAK